MRPIAFFDTEIDPNTKKVQDIGAFREPNQPFRSTKVQDLIHFLGDVSFVAGHNLIRHDLKYLEKEFNTAGLRLRPIDTLDLAPLLFPKKPYHKLVKDDKLQTEELNNPLNDAQKARDLFYEEVAEFKKLEPDFQAILFGLLQNEPGIDAFFKFLDFNSKPQSLPSAIKIVFQNHICENANLDKIIQQHPAELAYCLALIRVDDQYSIAPRWLNYSRPDIVQVMRLLRSNRCIQGCPYCNQANDALAGLKSIFNHEEFRTFGGEALQENAVKAALNYDSLLAVFPTGGGKSITFQLPALMQGLQNKGLTVIISPLQSLMKDQVDNLEKVGNVTAATINGQLDPIERSKAFERVKDGLVHILYISPEALRSPSIERLLSGRSINRFVIDEAHCFSSWGHDFRVDYLYIADFIKSLQKNKLSDEIIPVSCFTATAKPQVIEDIKQYFLEKLDLSLEIFKSDQARTNLHYKVYEQEDESSKYNTLRNIVAVHDSSTIVYVSRTKKAQELADRLVNDGYPALPYHGKLKSKTKKENQNSFISGETSIMVATSAFGMGVDKKDVKQVIHYEISDSLENYVQESGRAGRDETLKAECYILYNDDDLDKHFVLQNNTRVTIQEINQVWKSIKGLSKFRSTISKSALDIARHAGWDESLKEIETRITTAIATLEAAGYLKRKQNNATVYATSIQYKTAQDAIDHIMLSNLFSEHEKIQAKRIIRNLVSNKSRSWSDGDEGEARVDYIAELLSIPVEEVIHIVNLLRQEGILANDKDLTAYIKKGEKESKSLQITNDSRLIIDYLLSHIQETPRVISIKQINKDLEKSGHKVGLNEIKKSLLFLGIKNWILFRYINPEKTVIRIFALDTIDTLKGRFDRIHLLAPIIIRFLINESQKQEPTKEEVLVGFSIKDIMTEIVRVNDLQINDLTITEIEESLFYLSKIDSIDIEGGFFVMYKRLLIEKNEDRKTELFKKADYEKLEQYYQQKIEQVHIVGAYAKKMIHDYEGALAFLDDYFKLNYVSFVQKYFPGSTSEEIKRTITQKKFKALFSDLSLSQLAIINDKSKRIGVLAGPGSGKTRVLVHKLASIYLLENIKHEQILMLTFSRSAVTEIKKRLFTLIKNAAAFIEVKTFHSFCFSLLGRPGDLTMAGHVVKDALEAIHDGTIILTKLTRSILLIDEAQDINEEEYALIQALMTHNEDLRIILVGDDDQNIYEFRNSSSKFLEVFINRYKAQRYELLENYRSESALVQFTNRFVSTIRNRLKTLPIVPHSEKEGEVSIMECNHGPLSVAVAEKVSKAELSGTTAVLCQSNQEASEINSLLRKQNVNSRLIHSNEGFNLMHIVEVRSFVDQVRDGNEVIISKENWAEAKRESKNIYQRSQWLTMLQRLWKDFEDANPKAMYVSDLLAFVTESRLEDFIYEQSGTVLVSTYHKSKGREFDNVFITVNQPPGKDENKRALYVAMTRAKRKLVMLANSDFLKHISGEVPYAVDQTEYKRPDELSYLLTHEDVNLGYFASKQPQIEALMAGDALHVNEDGCKDMSGNFLVRFSNKFQQTILSQKKAGYELNGVGKVNFIVYWNVQEGMEVRVVLPEVAFLS